MQPFENADRVVVVLPRLDPTLGGHLALFELERAGFEAELGARVEFSTSDPGGGHRWLLEIDPAHDAAPSTSWEPGGATIVSRAADVAGIFEALNLWRTVRRRGGVAAATDCASLEEAIERVVVEVADTYPAFELRGLDWGSICERRLEAVRGADDPLAAAQAWLAELEDSHTWVWPGHANLPYALRVERDAVRFTHVPAESAGFAAGVRPGWLLEAVDEQHKDAAGWLERTAAPPHSRAALAGRRLLAGPAGVSRLLTATDAAGHRMSWEEEPATGPPEPVVAWGRLDPRTGYLRIAVWLDDVDDAVETALDELRGAARRSSSTCAGIPAGASSPPAARETVSSALRRPSARSATASAAACSRSRRRCSRSRPRVRGRAGSSSSPTSSPSPPARTSCSGCTGSRTCGWSGPRAAAAAAGRATSGCCRGGS